MRLTACCGARGFSGIGIRRHIKLHADIGYEFLKDLTQLGQITTTRRAASSRARSLGRRRIHPHGLSGDKIPLYARIVAVADTCLRRHVERSAGVSPKGCRTTSWTAFSRAGKQWDTKD